MQAVLLILTPLFPALCALLCWFVPALRPDKARDRFVLASLVASFLLTVALCLTGDGSLTLFTISQNLPVVAASDGLSRLFSILMSGMWLLSGAFSFGYMAHEGAQRRFYTFYLLTLSALLGLCFAGTLVTMYLCFELMTLLSVALVLHSLTKEAVAAGMKYLLYSIAGAMMGLLGIFFFTANAVTPLFVPGGTLSPDAVASQGPLLLWVLLITVIGFGTKAGLFPMHTWLPDAHSQAPSPVSALLSGVLLKCAMLVIMRFYGFTIQAVGAEYPQLLLLIVGTLSILVAALSMFRQDDLKRRFAYSSVENVGVIALCLGIGGPLGIAAALLHCVFHGFTKTLAFCVSGNIQHAFGTRSLAKIQGVVEVAPATAALAVLALLGLGAFPPFGMFISEFLTFVAGVTAGPMWLVVVVALGLTVAISALTRIALKSVFGHAPQGMGKHEAPALMLIPEIILAVMILWFGIATPLPLVHGVETATGIVLEQSTEELHATPMYRAVFGTETAQSEVE